MKPPAKPDVHGLDIEPAFVNVFNVVMNPSTTRIALGEFVIGDPKEDARYRHAFVMPTGGGRCVANPWHGSQFRYFACWAASRIITNLHSGTVVLTL